MTVGDIKIEYAKSGRASCRKCKGKIDQGVLRIGEMIQSPHFDGEQPMWHHHTCFLAKRKLNSTDLLIGFDGIKPVDQDQIRQLTGGGSSSSSSSSSSGSSSSVSSALSATLSSGDEYSVDYAKSSRSTCKHCNVKIDSGELRVGKMEQSERFDGITPRWHHLKCVFKAYVIVSIEQISGIDALQPDDQDLLKQLVTQHSPIKADSAAAGSASAGGSEAASAGSGKEEKKAGKKSKRARDDADSDGDKKKASNAKKAKPDYGSMSAAELKEECKKNGLAVSGTKTKLIERLEAADVEMTNADDSNDVDMKQSSSSSSSSSSNEDSEATKHERALRDEGTARWDLRNRVDQELSLPVVKAVLEHNNYPSTGGRDKLLDALVDAMMYGALPACPDCSQYKLYYEQGVYKCGGFSSAWSTCLFQSPEVKRSEFTLPKSYKKDFIDGWTFTVLVKPHESHQWKANKAKAVQEALRVQREHQEKLIADRQAQLDEKAAASTFLLGLHFAFSGKLSRSLPALRQLVEEHGGSGVNDIDDADVLISTEDAATKAKPAKPIKQAIEEGKPILKEAFLHDSIAQKKLVDPAAHALGSTSATELVKLISTKREEFEKNAASKRTGSGSSGTSKSTGKSGVVKQKVKGRAAVHEDSGLVDSAHVLDESADELYTVTLTMADIVRGSNSYYHLQLLENDARTRWYVLRRWGRVGSDVGSNHKLEPFYTKPEAKAHFQALYLDKSGNDWSDRNRFEKKHGKFMQVDIDYSGDTGDDPLSSSSSSSSSESTSKLDPRVQDLVRIFFDVQQMKAALMEMEIDLDRMPLGKLSKQTIEKGYSVLTTIQDLIKADNPSPSLLLAATNQFYSLIPRAFAVGKQPLIDNENELKRNIEIIEALMQMSVATSMLNEDKGSSSASQAKDPLDIHYEKLHTTIQPLDRQGDMFKLINTYLQNTHAETHRNYELELLDCFEIDREGELARFQSHAKDSNRMLLWHGSRTTNFVGILSQGLRIAPPEAPATGYMFGKGVYLANSSSKSANYCFTNSSNHIGFMLLCEAALGDMHELKQADFNASNLPKGKLSTKGVGQTTPDPRGFHTLDNGCVVPMGKLVKSNQKNLSLMYDEFIVYDVKQIQIRYLLKLDFRYNHHRMF